ncbi:hypothetical protein GCM10007907_37660 [Chitinimonas prasina]|uniref:Flagellar hook-associated protein 2 n=1 Tax=Chitinimonas prasina TaxID=1434937 RepID=A0ABQ5YJ11_9NEIS|nr:flagellar filament capping protein FliD [Chitinimonas prasina]GLR14976.1 hypothetical protein GCM10007907_37660 [Chitinimonas prasina]
MNLTNIASNLSRAYGLVSNDPLRLQSLERATGLNAAAGNGAGSSVGGLRLPGSTQVKLSDYGRLQSALTNLKTAVGGLDSDDEVAGVSLRSDSRQISANVDKKAGPLRAATVEVTQVAESQRLQSQAFDPSTLVGTGTLEIDFGRFNSSTNTFTQGDQATAQVSIGVLDSSLNGIANAINRAGVGISARVVQEDNSAKLELTGQNTGTDQAFRIRVRDNDANGTDSTQGLSRLAFDPVEQAGAGRNLTQLRAAQDAELKVDGRAVSSPSNQVSRALSGATLNIEGTGTARISLSRDASEASRSAGKLVAALNGFYSQAGNLQADGLTRRVANDLETALGSAESGSGLKRLNLSQLGVERTGEGRFKLDEEKFNRAFEANADGVTSLLSQVASEVKGVTENSTVTSQLRRSTEGLRAANTTDSNPFVAQARQTQLQNLLGNQATLLNYSPTTRNLYGLAQYLSVASF